MYSYNYRGVYDSKPSDHDGVAQVIDLCGFSLNQKIEYTCMFFLHEPSDQSSSGMRLLIMPRCAVIIMHFIP